MSVRDAAELKSGVSVAVASGVAVASSVGSAIGEPSTGDASTVGSVASGEGVLSGVA